MDSTEATNLVNMFFLWAFWPRSFKEASRCAIVPEQKSLASLVAFRAEQILELDLLAQAMHHLFENVAEGVDTSTAAGNCQGSLARAGGSQSIQIPCGADEICQGKLLCRQGCHIYAGIMALGAKFRRRSFQRSFSDGLWFWGHRRNWSSAKAAAIWIPGLVAEACHKRILCFGHVYKALHGSWGIATCHLKMHTEAHLPTLALLYLTRCSYWCCFPFNASSAE